MPKIGDMLPFFYCWFYNVLVISNFKLHDVNFIGYFSIFELSCAYVSFYLFVRRLGN
jgi:hypothetical protein